jgi:hypothetical protein
MTYSCHHNLSCFNFPHICAFKAFLCLPFTTINVASYILTEDTNIFAFSLHLNLKHGLKVINFPRHVIPQMDVANGWFVVAAGGSQVRDTSTLRKQTTLVRVPVSAHLFFLYVLYSQTLN